MIHKKSVILIIIAIASVSCVSMLQYTPAESSEKEPTGVFKSKAFTVKDLKTVRGPNYYDIQGTIKNITNETITGIYMDIATYNATGNYNGVVVHKVEPTMEPQQEYSFDVTVCDSIGQVDHYIITRTSDR